MNTPTKEITLLKIFDSCIETQLIPSVGSPCHNEIKKIISGYINDSEEIEEEKCKKA